MATQLITGLGGKCLDIRGGVDTSGTPMILFAIHGGSNQLWELLPTGEIISILNPNKCLDIMGGVTENGTPIILWDRHGGPNQKWVYQNGFILSALDMNKCIDVQGGDAVDGTPIILWDYHGGPNQKWDFSTPPFQAPNKPRFNVRHYEGGIIAEAIGDEPEYPIDLKPFLEALYEGLKALALGLKELGVGLYKLVTAPVAGRSVLILIRNRTGQTLYLKNSKHDHGRFEEEAGPSQNIPDKATGIIISTSKDWAVGTGTEGSIIFTGNGFEYNIHWNNPFIGGNSCSAKVEGEDITGFGSISKITDGNDRAEATFDLIYNSMVPHQ